MSWREPLLRLLDLGQDVHQVAPALGEQMIEQLALLRQELAPAPPGDIEALERCLRRARSGDIAKVLRYLHKDRAVSEALRKGT